MVYHIKFTMIVPRICFKRKALVLCTGLLLLGLNRANAQGAAIHADAQQLAALKQQATEFTTAIQQHDAATLVKYTYPAVMKLRGGKAKVEQNLKEGFTKMQQAGFSLTSVTPGEVKQVEQSGGKWFALLTYVVQGNINGSIVTHGSYLLGVSVNGGKRWYFLDAPVLKKIGTQKLFPNFPKNLMIPDLKTEGLIPN